MTQAVPASGVPPALRLLRGLGVLLLAGLLLAGASVAGLWWWSAREGSLATALDWLQARPGLGLQAQQVSGSLRHGGRVEQLSWQQPQGGLRLQASEVALRWDLASLLRSAWSGRRTLHLLALEAGQVRLEPSASAEPRQAPASLALPMELQVDRLGVRQLVWAGSPGWQAQDLAGRYHYDGQAHQLTLDSARMAEGRYQGQARVQAQPPFALELDLHGQLLSTLPGRTRPLPMQLQASAGGTLTQIALQARLDSEPGPQRSRAELQAQLTPWQDPPLPQAQARLDDIDLAALWPRAPATRLSGKLRVAPQGRGWRWETELRNAAPGPWNEGGLPLDHLDARGQWLDASLRVDTLTAQLGPGRIQAQGDWMPGTGQPGWQLQVRMEQLPLAAIDSRWPTQSLQGSGRAQQDAGTRQPLRFEAQLQAAPGQARDALARWRLSQAQVRGQWQPNLWQLDDLQLRSSDSHLQASGHYQPGSGRGQGQLRLQAPGLAGRMDSAWPLAQGVGNLTLQLSEPPLALRWLRSLPGLPADWTQAMAAVQVQGQAGLDLAWTAGLPQAQVQARLDMPRMDAPGLALRQVQATLKGRLAQAQVQMQGHLDGPRPVSARLQGELALPAGALQQALAGQPQRLAWHAVLARLELDLADPSRALWRLRNPQPLQLEGGLQRVAVAPGQLQLQAPGPASQPPALLAWQSLTWQAGELRSSGSLHGLPLSWAELLAGPVLRRAGMVGDLLFDGRWNLQLGAKLQVQAALERRSGDLSLHAETGQGLAARVAAGVREARLSLDTDGQALVMGWRWDSERAGQTEGQLRTRLERQAGGWRWPEDAPLSGRLQARLPRLGVWSALAPPGWRLRGSLATELAVGGTRARPRLSGPLAADDLALRSVVEGIELGRGRLRATLDGERLLLEEFSLQGPGPQGGSLRASGQASWAQGPVQLQMQARLQQLRASVRPDRELTVSGDLQARLLGPPQRQPLEVTGVLRLDQARIRLPDEDRPQLDSDVVVRRGTAAGTPAPAPAARRQASPLSLAVRLDLGEDFRLEGKGVQARLRGSLAVVTHQWPATPRLFGSIDTASGEYRAYGQRLEIERGLLRFTGAADNPSLDILALRPHLTQKVGVQVTGTALLPRVRLYAEPELPDAEKLAWLVLGRSGAAGGAEAAVLQQAAIALLGNRSAVNPGGLAASLGLDELSFRGSTTGSGSGDPSATSGAITFGKRLSNHFYAAYESSLSGAVGTLLLFYELSQRLTVRAQTGAQTAIDLIYTLPYD